jgi:hypothetical protein
MWSNAQSDTPTTAGDMPTEADLKQYMRDARLLHWCRSRIWFVTAASQVRTHRQPFASLALFITEYRNLLFTRIGLVVWLNALFKNIQLTCKRWVCA